MKRIVVYLTLILSLTAPLTAAAQTADGVTPRAVRLSLLPKEAEGSSSLFFLDDTLWTCNDHGRLRLFALDTLGGGITATVDLGVKVHDLEEVCLDSAYIYFGDFGNNNGTRTDLRILRLSRSDFARRHFHFDTIHFVYPASAGRLDRDFDCEAFVSIGDSLLLFTKQWISQGSECYAIPKAPGSQTAHMARLCGSFPTHGLVTGASYHPTRRTLVLVGYTLLLRPFAYIVQNFDSGRFDSGTARRLLLDIPVGTQTEAIASGDGRHFFLTNETFSLSFLTFPAALLSLDLSPYL